jgi:hypothetical protein
VLITATATTRGHERGAFSALSRSIYILRNQAPETSTVAPMEPPNPSSVRRIAIVGTGVIGSGWAAVFLAKGYEVTAFVRSEASEKKFQAFLEKAWSKVLARGLTADASGWKRVKCVRNLAECVADVDYVQESVVEDLILKQDILAQIDQHTPDHVVVGTSSSFIPASLCAARATKCPRRIATAHPTLPQFDPFVEVFGMTTAVEAWAVEFFGPSHVGMDVVLVRRENHVSARQTCPGRFLAQVTQVKFVLTGECMHACAPSCGPLCCVCACVCVCVCIRGTCSTRSPIRYAARPLSSSTVASAPQVTSTGPWCTSVA